MAGGFKMLLRLLMAIEQAYGKQVTFAEAINVREDVLSRMIHGRRKPTTEERRAICDALGISYPGSEVFHDESGRS